MTVCPPEVFALLVRETAALARAVTACAMRSAADAQAALRPLRRCLEAARPSPEHLTPMHAAFLQACAPPPSPPRVWLQGKGALSRHDIRVCVLVFCEHILSLQLCPASSSFAPGAARRCQH